MYWNKGYIELKTDKLGNSFVELQLDNRKDLENAKNYLSKNDYNWFTPNIQGSKTIWILLD
jgi:hypothetical protein